MKRIAHAVVAGAIFGLGLVVSGMTNPDKVLNFLDVAGQWDPSLALVMGAALAVSMPGFAWLRRRGCTLDGGALPAQPGARIDRRLLIGSALFGIGWGLAGYCPGLRWRTSPTVAAMPSSSLSRCWPARSLPGSFPLWKNVHDPCPAPDIDAGQRPAVRRDGSCA